MKLLKMRFALILSLMLVFTIGCQKEVTDQQLETYDLSGEKNQANDPFLFDAPVFDISSTPDGSIMVAVNSGDVRTIQIIKNGKIRTVEDVEVATDIQGIQSIGTGNAFITTAGTDLAENGELYRVSNGNVRMVADLAKFERDFDPDANEGVQWKKVECENYGGFSEGPQNNPFKVTAIDGETAIVADAAGNTILSATTEGVIDWKAILTPPIENGDYMKFFETDGGIDCFVQPVPTSVALGPDGYLYVGELTGEVDGGLPIGLSRVWRFPADANNLVCSEIEGSENCNLFLEGLTSVIDLEFGPDGLLYVVEYDENSWIAPFIPAFAGGTVSAYNMEGEMVKQVTDLNLPSAITIDKKGNIWILENNIFAPSVRLLQESEFVYM